MKNNIIKSLTRFTFFTIEKKQLHECIYKKKNTLTTKIVFIIIILLVITSRMCSGSVRVVFVVMLVIDYCVDFIVLLYTCPLWTMDVLIIFTNQSCVRTIHIQQDFIIIFNIRTKTYITRTKIIIYYKINSYIL